MDGLCEESLEAVRQRAEPTQAQRDQANASQRHLRGLLAETRVGRRVLDVYMSGSFARHTAIRPVDDVDLIFEVDPTQWKLPLFGDKPEPARLLDSFRGAIERLYPGSSFRRQRRSVGLTLSHVHIDLVPAVATKSGALWIPDREAGEWIDSNPKAHAADATAMNKACAERGKAMIKLLKHWNAQLPDDAHLKSFVVETLAVRILGPEGVASLTDGLLCFWDNVVALAGGESSFEWASSPRAIDVSFFGRLLLRDATGKNIAEGVSRETLDRFARRARIARDHLAGALNARKVANAREHLGHLF